MPALFVAAVCTQFIMRLIAWIGMALFIQMVGVLAVKTAGLEALALVLRGTLLVVALVLFATTIITELVLLALTMMMTMIVIIALSVQPVALALIGEMAHLARVLLLQLLVHLVPCFRLNLFELMVLEASIVLMCLIDRLKVLCKSL
jgi:hypothetical protein